MSCYCDPPVKKSVETVTGSQPAEVSVVELLATRDYDVIVLPLDWVSVSVGMELDIIASH